MLLNLLTAPVGVPIAGLKFVLEQLRDLVERELHDEGRIREDLLLLQLRLDEGELTEEEYERLEEEVMVRLRAAREYRRAMAASDAEPDSGSGRAVVEFEGDVYES